MKKINFIIVLVILTLGCKKENETITILKGNVIELYNHAILNYGKLNLISVEIDPSDSLLK